MKIQILLRINPSGAVVTSASLNINNARKPVLHAMMVTSHVASQNVFPTCLPATTETAMASVRVPSILVKTFVSSQPQLGRCQLKFQQQQQQQEKLQLYYNTEPLKFNIRCQLCFLFQFLLLKNTFYIYLTGKRSKIFSH